MSAQSITFYRHYICFAENLSVAVVVNANILIIRRFKMGVTEKTAILGYRDELFLNDEFTRYADVYVATEDGSAPVDF